MAESFAGAEQALVGYLSNDEWQVLLDDLNQRVERMEALPEGQTKQEVFGLLNGIDALHRESLRRLVRLFKQGVLEQVITDPAIHTLMELYDLLPDAAAAGPPSPAPKFPTIPIRALSAAPPAPAPLRYPHWVPVLASADEPTVGVLCDHIAVDGLPLLLARRDEQWFALDAQCPLDGASLEGWSLSGYTLTCPSHAGCHYDIRNGSRIGGGPGLGCHPVKIDEGGRVLVGRDMDFKPALPSF
jgi:nitrite reductase/ring-hydroxylating ferredoxin subunit